MIWPEHMTNVGAPAPKMVRLIGGQEVESGSEAWRLECEARHVLALPSRRLRREYLLRIEQRRGLEARMTLEARIRAIWDALRQDNGDTTIAERA